MHWKQRQFQSRGVAIGEDFELDKEILALANAPALVHYGRAQDAQIMGKMRTALEEYVLAITADQTWFLPHYDVGVIMYRNGDLLNAERAFDRAVTLEPDWAPGYFNLAQCFRDKGELDLAHACYIEYCKRVPKDADGHLGVASILGKLGRRAEENEVYQHIFTITDRCTPAHFNYAINQFNARAKSDAKRHLARVIELEECGSNLSQKARNLMDLC